MIVDGSPSRLVTGSGARKSKRPSFHKGCLLHGADIRSSDEIVGRVRWDGMGDGDGDSDLVRILALSQLKGLWYGYYGVPG